MFKNCFSLAKKYSLVLLIALGLISCHPNVRLAKKLSGKWTLSELKMDTTKFERQNEFYFDRSNIWNFLYCYTGQYEGRLCEGNVSGIQRSDSLSTFKWHVYYRGTHFDIPENRFDSPWNGLFYGANWEFKEITRNKMVLTTETCSLCAIYGKITLVFLRL